MDHPYRLIVFDFDGTLVDSRAVIVRAMADGFAEAGLAPPSAAAVLRVVGLTLEIAIGRLLPESCGDDMIPAVAEAYRRSFFAQRTRPDFSEPLIAGAREVLRVLDRPEVCLAIATGKARRGLVACLEHHGLTHHFATLQTPDNAPGKPHPGMVCQAMAEVGAAPGETVVIGDTVFDMEMALNAGAWAIGVSWGYHEPDELLAAGASLVLDSFDDLPAALAGLGAGGSMR
ncbi:MAG: HAD-IA family hydrolase [Kiloniellaceae bacterium]